MTASDPHELPGVEEVGEELHDLIRELFPICPTTTGPDVAHVARDEDPHR